MILFHFYKKNDAGSGSGSFRAQIILKVSEIESIQNFWSIWHVKTFFNFRKIIFAVWPKIFFVKSLEFPRIWLGIDRIPFVGFVMSIWYYWKSWSFRKIFFKSKKIFYFLVQKKVLTYQILYTFDFWHFEDDLSTETARTRRRFFCKNETQSYGILLT